MNNAIVVEAVRLAVEKTQPEYLIWLGDQGVMPAELALRNLELFATTVMPEFQ